MAYIHIPNVTIKGISACVPKQVIKNESLNHIFPEEELKKTIESVGIKERRISNENICASDLCYNAAEKLLSS